MKTRFSLSLGMVLLLSSRLAAAPTVGNDGTTTTNLTQLSNLNGTGGATVSLESTNGVLVAAQDLAADIPLRTVWFLNTQAPTSGVYGVSADFKPASEEGVDMAVYRGGVMGWLDLGSRQGIALLVVPATQDGYFQVATVNFLATDDSSNESFANLFNPLDGTPASVDSTPAFSDLGNYAPGTAATFQLEFTKTSAADLAAVSNATAHVTAMVFQNDAGGIPFQVGRTIELLTDLPAPPAGVREHRVGYYGYWGSLFREGSVIGEFDNLALVDGFAPVTNQPPQVTITAPETGSSATEPVDLTITADASDVDGLVVQVVFLDGTDGTTPLATNSVPPFSYDWLGVPVGTHVLTAEATDDRGARATSQSVTFTVLPPFNAPPTVTLVTPTDGEVFTAPGPINLLADATDIDDEVNQVEFFWGGTNFIGASTSEPFSVVWTNVAAGSYSLAAKATDAGGASATSTNQVTITVNGQPGEQPVLSIELIRPDNNAVQLSWPSPFTGYQLQSTRNLLVPAWEDSQASTNNFVVFTISGPQTYFRLIKR